MFYKKNKLKLVAIILFQLFYNFKKNTHVKMRILFRGGKYIHLKGKFYVLFEKFNMVDLEIIYYRQGKKTSEKAWLTLKLYIIENTRKKQTG